MDVQEVFLSNVNQFSQGNTVLDAPSSKQNGFLCWDTCVSTNQLNQLIWNKRGYLYLEKPKWLEVFL
jgi:hypothetical protein